MKPDRQPRRRLDSWKEVARYLNRHVTTVRRWERDEKLPVHRHRHSRLGSIYAYTDELDAWREGRRQDGASSEDLPADVASLAGAICPERAPNRISYPGSLLRHLGRSRAILAGIVAFVAVALTAWVGMTARAFDEPHAAERPRSMTSIDPTAHDHLLQARFFFNRRQPGDLERAAVSYRRALDLRPGLAPAWAGLAGVYYIAAQRPEPFGLTRDAALEKARDAAERALRLDPNLAEAHVRRANLMFEQGDLEGARQHLRYATTLEPDNPLALGNLAGIAFNDGRLKEAISLQRRAVLHEPLALVGRASLGIYLFAAGRFEEARAELQTVLQIAGSPASSRDEFTLGVAWDFARSLIAEHRFAEAVAYASGWPETAFRDDVLALAQYGLGHDAEANAALMRMSTTSQADISALVAEAYAYRGEADEAFRWLAAAGERARLSGVSWQPWKLELRHSPFIASLHEDPRWRAWLAGNPGLL